MLKELKRQVLEANQALVKNGLVVLTWGNVSGIDRAKGLVAIKPSGVTYDRLKPESMVVVDLKGKVVEGKLKPSMDTPTHLALYNAWPEVGGVCHTHSACAVMFSQARREIPCLGTTHADHFFGPVPVTRSLTEKEVAGDYETHTGKVILELFARRPGLKPLLMPAVLVSNHGPFCWGRSAKEAADNSLALEEIAKMAVGTLQLNPGVRLLEKYILNRHYLRKHGPKASYGQKKNRQP
jgi:L-ribulose-5-phosphate 4-epimerase